MKRKPRIRRYPAPQYPRAEEIRHMPIKRTFDIIFSIACLVLLTPLMLFIALLVKCTSRGPVFFSHERIGRGGRKFKCYKFRSMYQDSADRLKKILATNAELRREWEESQKLKYDPRITPLGRFLRKTCLDELPQFWNVLRGDLSIVGPRAVVEREIIRFLGPRAAKILTIRPGLTGLWQVSGRSDTSYGKRIQLDELYVEQRSMRTDLKLIAKTIPAMFSSRGAY